jgi:ADP-ribose pyrophosphatase YjhB (NUDIX family)/catechol 2,3-dioxygenase-like lactoylglutathione lyase family enzyme
MTDLRGWRWCPRCGAGVEVSGEGARCDACGYRAYANPAPAACALVLDGAGNVLLGRRARDPERGRWDALGGFVHEDEQLLDALRRELAEETGCEVEPLDYVGGYPDRYGDAGGATLNLYWTARIVSGEPRPADDVAELRWFALEELPPAHELAFANVGLALTVLKRRLGERSWPEGMFEIQLVTCGLDELEAFYRDHLGLTVSIRDDARGRVHFRLRRGQLILARAEAEVEASPDWPGLPPPLLREGDPRGATPPAHGPLHFALGLDATGLVGEGERLRAAGHDVRGPFRWPGGELSIYLRDPDGNVVELISSR